MDYNIYGELSQRTSDTFFSELLIGALSECSWRAIQTCTLLKELFCSVFPIGKIIPMVEYFGLKRAVFCSLNPLELFFRDQTNSKSRQPSLLMEKVEQEVEWHAPFARRTAMQAIVPALYVIVCSHCVSLENAPARGRPGDAADPGFGDILDKLLQLVCCCLSSQLLEHWPDFTFG